MESCSPDICHMLLPEAGACCGGWMTHVAEERMRGTKPFWFLKRRSFEKKKLLRSFHKLSHLSLNLKQEFFTWGHLGCLLALEHLWKNIICYCLVFIIFTEDKFTYVYLKEINVPAWPWTHYIPSDDWISSCVQLQSSGTTDVHAGLSEVPSIEPKFFYLLGKLSTNCVIS